MSKTTTERKTAKSIIRAGIAKHQKSETILKAVHKLFPDSNANELHVRKYVSELLNEDVISMEERDSYYTSGRARPTGPVGRTFMKIQREKAEAEKAAKAKTRKAKRSVKKVKKAA